MAGGRGEGGEGDDYDEQQAGLLHEQVELLALMRDSGVTGAQLQPPSGSCATARPSPGLDPPAAAQVLLHELGHVLAHASLSYLPGASTAGCRGIQKIEADSITCIVATRLGMDTSIYRWPYVASWAGSDPRARPEETVRAAGERITQAAGVVAAHPDVALFGVPGQHAPGVRRHVLGFAGAPEERAVPVQRPVTDSAPPAAVLSRMLLDAERFYRARLGDSWVPGYLAARGLDPATVKQWRIGYAPTGWTTLTSHLRRLGYGDAAIEAAGLARRSRKLGNPALLNLGQDRLVDARRACCCAPQRGRWPPDHRERAAERPNLHLRNRQGPFGRPYRRLGRVNYLSLRDGE